MIIKEDYVSFETAKLLSDKGFNEPTLAYAYGDDMMSYYSRPKITDLLNIAAGKIPMPTLQMAMKWLREVHNIHIIVTPYTDKEGQNWSFIFDKYAYDCWQELGIYITDSWSSYEEACEVAIKYCLENLI